MPPFRLKIWKIEQTCVFELSWGQGQQLTAKLPFPPTLTACYQAWQQAYINFYSSALRARRKMSGGMPPPPLDLRALLVQAEAQLLAEFHYWLSSAELLPLRQEIAKVLVEDGLSSPVDLFLTCNDLELSRLPWEIWEIGTEFAINRTLRIARTAVNIREVPAQSKHHGKVRVLAILGDDTGLSLQADRSALQSLSPIADVVLFDCQKETNGDSLIDQIRQAIADPQGWDILFFAGHSSETTLTGGELAITPDVTILLSEIAPQLIQAKEQGLQFAIFNSCNGLTIAEMLVDLGLSQVAVMREPIHNQVAQEFLLRFLQAVVAYQDVQDATLFACQHLKLERNLTYPSAYLIPSLFRHPDTKPFQLQPWGWKQQVKRWLPTKGEVIGLSVLLALTLIPPIPGWLMDQRVLVQAIYRQQLAQIRQPESVSKPPVVLVQIDEKSIKRAKITDPKPIPRAYLAKLVKQVSALDARVIGIDYLLDRPHPQDPDLQKLIQEDLKQQSTWFVFATSEDLTGEWLTINPKIASPNWSLQGDIWVPFWQIRPLPWEGESIRPFPFAYLLATAYRLETEPFQTSPCLLAPQPNLRNAGNLLSQINTYAKEIVPQTPKPLITDSMKLGDITALSYSIGQRWLQPLFDFSIPPNQVYIPLPAWQLLEQPDQILKLQGLSSLKDAIVIIAAGGYGEAGIKDGEDNFSLPPAVAYWRDQLHLQAHNQPSNDRSFSGGEANAYMTHHFLTHHLVIPIPDLWMVLLAIPIGKALSLKLKNQRLLLLLSTGTTIGYGAVCLHLYSSVAILLPWLLPTATLWMYILLTQKRRNHA